MTCDNIFCLLVAHSECCDGLSFGCPSQSAFDDRPAGHLSASGHRPAAPQAVHYETHWYTCGFPKLPMSLCCLGLKREVRALVVPLLSVDFETCW